MKVTVIGSTGLIGKELVEILDNSLEIEKIYLPVRNLKAVASNKIHIEVVDFQKLENSKHLFESDVVFCCLGTTMAKAKTREKFREVDFDFVMNSAKRAKAMKVSKFFVVTALGSDKNSMIFYNRVKAEVESELTKLEFPFLGIIRPSLLLGSREETRPGEKLGEIVGGIFSFAMVGPLKRYRPIEGRTVAKAMYKLSKENRTGTQIFESEELQELGENQ
ncbi:MAG: NAD(P)H-binding protein [Leptospiraceae bacterium]|nr:NAD(P)H-binding protein [Leptospiraceae bacterium]